MNILFLGCLYSQNHIKLFQEKSSRGYQYAAQNFQISLIDGFSQFPSVSLNVLTIPSLSTFPLGTKLLKVPDSKFMFQGKQCGKSFGYINLPFINHIKQSRIDRYIDNWYINNNGDKCIIVYAMLKNQMHYAVAAKKRHPEIKLCLVVPDLPIYMNCNKYYRFLGLQKHDMKIIDILLHSFDCFVVLTEPMVKELHIESKPYTVVEGIYSALKSHKEEIEDKFNEKTIMYAGGIQTRYGVFDLIEAFLRIKDENLKLILCGPCQETEKLNSFLVKDSRVSYLGVIPTADVRSLQRKVSLLVNPRHSSEEFTKYSFPSKTLEYMASGTPVLMSNLASLPKEYKPYIYLFEDESIDGMKSMLERICSLDKDVLDKKGKSAKQYILNKKCSIVQVERILKMLIDMQ